MIHVSVDRLGNRLIRELDKPVRTKDLTKLTLVVPQHVERIQPGGPKGRNECSRDPDKGQKRCDAKIDHRVC